MAETISRYKNVSHVLDGRFERVRLLESEQVMFYTVKSGDDLKHIAWQSESLGNAQYYWIIAELNNIVFIHDKLEAGTKLKIPPPEILRRI